MKLIGLEPGQLYVLLLPEGDYGTAHRTAQIFREQVSGMANPPRVVVLLGDVELVGVRELSPEQHAAVAAALATAEPQEPDNAWTDWNPVKSSNIDALRHIGPEQALLVRFHNLTVYRYWPVSEETFDAFLGAESKGKLFASQIKGVYEYRKLLPEEVPN